MRKILLSLVAVALFAVPAFAQGAQGGSGAAAMMLAEVQSQATFCDGTYALCIKAPCSAIPVLDRLGNYVVNSALCSCDVVQGWSMGPGACIDHGPVKQGGRTYLISTYSNADNASEKTLSCSNTTWAWCYGAPCVVDEKDPKKAVCTCPVKEGPAKTLGGNCQQGACDRIWSAATPAGDAFANVHYYEWMKKNQPSVSVNGPAAACPASTGGNP